MVEAEGRTRRVLQDIGNLVPDRAVEGKPGPQPAEKNKVEIWHNNPDNVVNLSQILMKT